MRRKSVGLAFAVIVVLVVVAALNGDRLYGWLLALHGVPARH